MSEPIIFQPTVTQAGEAAAFNAQSNGLELTLTHVSFGSGAYDPTGEETALLSEIKRVTISGGSRVNPTQIRMLSIWPDDSAFPLTNTGAIGEVGFWAGDTLFSVWSKNSPDPMGYKTPGVDFVLFNDLVFKQLGPDSVTVLVDPAGSASLAALSAHEGAFNAHPQYLLRRDVVADSGPLAWTGLAAGTADALVLTLVDAEAQLLAYTAGQRFQFMAAANNTGPVTANIEALGVLAIKKAGDNGLADIEAGDIKAGAILDLTYDGTFFQLGGGVGGGKAFERYSFTASVAQTIFPAEHTIGAIIVLRNGREITDFVSAVDGLSITLTTPCNLDDSVEILAFKSFKVADAYTKAEIDALWQTASALPVGAMLPFTMAIVPPGFVEVAGQVLSKTGLPDLYAYIGDVFAVGGEPVGFFRMPESRAEFLRGWDHGRGVDAGRALGSYQLGAVESHDHLTYSADKYSSPASLGSSGSVAPHNIGTAAGIRTGMTGGAETRPRNLAVMWCMKAWNAPINQGQIDIAALAAQVETQALAHGPALLALKSSASGTSPLVQVSADGIAVLGATGYQRLANVSLSISAAAAGPNGLDAGALSASTWYSVWVIWDGTAVSGLLSLSATAPTLPAGYTHKARVGWIRTDGTANKYPLSFYQFDDLVQIDKVAGSNVAAMITPAAGTTGGVMTAVSLINFIPPTAKTARVTGYSSGDATAQIAVAPSTSYTIYEYTGGSGPSSVAGYYALAALAEVALKTPSSIAWQSNSANARLYLQGWRDNL